MKLINNMKTGVKLLGGFLLVAAMLVVVAFVGYNSMKTIKLGESNETEHS